MQEYKNARKTYEDFFIYEIFEDPMGTFNSTCKEMVKNGTKTAPFSSFLENRKNNARATCLNKKLLSSYTFLISLLYVLYKV